MYNFPSGGAGLANWMDTYDNNKFVHQIDPKDGYPVRDCRNARHRRLLEFIVPIIHPDKPTWVTITIGNTIFGALDSERLVDWGVVFWDLALRLAVGIGKPKPTLIFSFLFHLYNSQGLLTDEKEMDYKTAQELAGYWIILEPESKPESDEKKQANTPSCLTNMREALATPQPAHADEADLPSTARVTTSPVKGRRKSATTGATTGSATRSSIGLSCHKETRKNRKRRCDPGFASPLRPSSTTSGK